MSMNKLTHCIRIALSEPRGRDIATIYAYWRHSAITLPWFQNGQGDC